MDSASNPYLPVIYRNLPRLLALYNVDTTHPLCGCGDRRYWAWKLIDFPNGTFQGAAFGLAKLLDAGFLPANMDAQRVQRRIEQMINVIPTIADSQGALGEALPNEGSFCVTGLVVADCLGAIAALGSRLSDAKHKHLLDCLAPCVQFLLRQDETHGVISNHLATTALALVRWQNMTGDHSAGNRARQLVDRIKTHAHEEGWMREYGGADPGYQSWCTSSLGQISRESSDIIVDDLLEKSFKFMEAFANGDGTYANGCGARLTRFIMASGAEICAKDFEPALRLANFTRQFAGENTYTSLDSIDEPNLVPFFNDLVLAAVNAKPLSKKTLPSTQSISFPEAGLLTVPMDGKKVTINHKRGGWMSISSKTNGTEIRNEPAAVSGNGKILRPVCCEVTVLSESEIVIQAELEPVERMLPSPFKFIVLRILSLTAFRSAKLGNLVKQALANILLSEKGKSVGQVTRRINLGTGTVSDTLTKNPSGDLKLIEDATGFSPMHMASQGYWQVNDDTTPEG